MTRRVPFLPAALLLLGLAAAACDEPAAVVELRVRAAGFLEYAAVVEQGVGGPRYTCEGVRVELAATGGREGAYATWTGATLSLASLGGERQLGTEAFSGDEVAAWVGSDRIHSGETQSMLWDVWGSEPFRVTAEYAYRPGGEAADRQAAFEFVCR